MQRSVAILFLAAAGYCLSGCAGSSSGSGGEISSSPPPAVADRLDVFDTFSIRGAGGIYDIESAAAHGANTVRTWAVGDNTGALLGEAQTLGLKVILGVWLPNPDDAATYRDPGRWRVDYNARQAEYVAQMQTLLDQFDGHPALLMWCLGNEIDLSISFLQTINAMSQAIHSHNPDRISCYVGRAATDIDLFVEHATEIDIYGANAYGANSLSTTAQTIDDKWGKRFFFAEYGWRGPWSAPVSASGYPMEFTPAQKVDQLLSAFDVFPQHDNLVGNVFFLWAPFNKGTQTWFSGLLPTDPAAELDTVPAHLTPFTDTLQAIWTGIEVTDHAPVITRAAIEGIYAANIVLNAGQDFLAHADASDPEGDPLNFSFWIFETSGGTRGALVDGPHAGGPDMLLQAPTTPGNYSLLVYVTSGTNKASSHQVPFQVN